MSCSCLRPKVLIKLLDLESGCLFEAGHLLNFPSDVCLFCNKAINVKNKMQRYNSKVSVKYSEENSVLREVSYWYLFNFNLIVTLFNE